jgi:hypothetical protein
MVTSAEVLIAQRGSTRARNLGYQREAVEKTKNSKLSVWRSGATGVTGFRFGRTVNEEG